MDMFGTADYLENQTLLAALEVFIERGDAKGAIHHLRQLDKENLSITLLKSGFGLVGNYRNWIDHAGDKILKAAEIGRLPRIQFMNGLAKDLHEQLTDLGKPTTGAKSSKGNYCLTVEVSTYEEALIKPAWEAEAAYTAMGRVLAEKLAQTVIDARRYPEEGEN
jgi:hypothetical protein